MVVKTRKPDSTITKKIESTKARKLKEVPPPLAETRQNIEKPDLDQIVALNFKIPFRVKKDFKQIAAELNITQSELLKRAIGAYKQREGIA